MTLNHTCENSSAFPLILWIASCLALLREGRFEHEAGYIVILFELGLPHFQLGLLEVRSYVRDLNVRYLRIQFAYIDRHGIHYHLNILRAEFFTVQTQQTFRYLR